MLFMTIGEESDATSPIQRAAEWWNQGCGQTTPDAVRTREAADRLDHAEGPKVGTPGSASAPQPVKPGRQAGPTNKRRRPHHNPTAHPHP
ncbi:hypothetical protein, partial [Kitasatospora aureofaciens]|uniref:hypothetical protein n=1 Tax=Kitasatospora aureofaciens TaxID=1894 RepID=UPI001E28A198